MYLCSQSVDLLKYHLKHKNVQYEYVVAKDSNIVISYLYKGNPLKKPCYLINYLGKSKLKIESKSKFNSIYLVCSSRAIDKSLLKKDWVEVLTINSSLYTSQFKQYKQLFYPDAADYFLSKFENNPYQFNIELMKSLIKVSIDKQLIDLDYLQKQYEYLGAPTLLNSVGLLGTISMLKLIRGVSKNELWIFFIDRGDKRSILEEYLLKRIDSDVALQGLMYLKQAVYENTMNLDNACYLYNLWLYQTSSIEVLIKWLNL